jgi:PAP2 superfamily
VQDSRTPNRKSKQEIAMSRVAQWTMSLLFLLGAGTPASADAITDWNEKASALVMKHRMLPPQAERIIACMHVAMFDAVNALDRRYQPYGISISAPKNASKEAAAAAAAGGVLVQLFPNDGEELRAALSSYLAPIPDGPAKSSGIKLGEDVAAKTLMDRQGDGADAPDAYRPKTKPGVYVPTSITASSMWPKVKPFAMTSPSQFRPQPPVALTSAEWAADYNEIKSVGGKTSKQRTARQTEDGKFWLITGPVSYYPIVRQLVTAKRMELVDSARFMALVSTAVADSFIAVFDAKYHYEFWRPITAIRNGDTDDNPTTDLDATWQPIDNTPMHPEYPCAHCISSAAVAYVIEALLGSADIPEVAMTSATAPGVTHRWTNVWAYADEVSLARIYAGFHYRFSTRVGQDMGSKIGRLVTQKLMQEANVAAR